jgi:hypothetical protein
LDVGLHENTVPPRILPATEGFCFVVGAEVAEDASALRIGGANLGLAVEHAIELIKIDGLGDVGGDYGVIFADLGDAIYLDSEDYRNTVFFELTSKFDGFRGAPTVAKNNDTGVLFFLGDRVPSWLGCKKRRTAWWASLPRWFSNIWT